MIFQTERGTLALRPRTEHCRRESERENPLRGRNGVGVGGREVTLNTHKHYKDFIITTQWGIFYRSILNVTRPDPWPHPCVWTHMGQSDHYQEWETEGWEPLFRALTYITVLMSLICLLFWSYHYWDPMVQYEHSPQNALWPQSQDRTKNPNALLPPHRKLKQDIQP